ncbi:UNVERIFIED_CONTAM: hypothetical protein FKN15_010850 [Acipenser sinensis]
MMHHYYSQMTSGNLLACRGVSKSYKNFISGLGLFYNKQSTSSFYHYTRQL